MPQAQVIQTREELPNPLARTLDSFIKRKASSEESDALESIYKKYNENGKNIDLAMQELDTNPKISPTRRVEVTQNLLKSKQLNDEFQKKEIERLQNQQILRDLEKQRGLEEGSLDAYVRDPKMAEQVTRPTKQNQADRPIDPDQQRRIDQVQNSPEWQKATIPQKQQLLTRGGVSNSNSKPIIESLVEDQKLTADKEKIDRETSLQFHKETKDYDEDLNKAAKSAKNQLSAIKDTRKALESKDVSPSSLANVFRSFGDVGRRISDALLTKDEATILASVPAFLEGRKELFGVRLSDADLAILQDKLPDIGKSKEANIAILNLMERYSNAAILRENIAREIKKENKGLRPLNYPDLVEERFDEMMAPIKIRNPETGRVVDIPAYQASDYIRAGGQLVQDEGQDE